MLHWLVKLRRRVFSPFGAYGRFGIRPALLALSVLIGIAAALAAALLHTLVEYLTRWGIRIDSSPELWSGKSAWLGVVIFVPFAGIALSYLVQRCFGGPRYAKSLSPLVLALDRHKSGGQFRDIFTHLFSSALAVGLGGSAGLEAPSVLSGAAIGSVSGSFFRVARQYRILLVGCGAASAISAIFNSPVGGVLFAVEVLLPEFSVGALVPMLMASATAAVVSRVIVPHASVSMLKVLGSWQPEAVPFYLLLGVVCALLGVYIVRSSYALNKFLKHHLPNAWTRLAIGGLALCLVLTLFPVLRGQGYWFIAEVFRGNPGALAEASPLLRSILPENIVLALLVAAAILLKTITSVLTVESGGDGGIFAPTMFVGAFTGFAFARLVNLSGIFTLNEANFLVVGMCGVFTAVMRAPLTGIFLIAEVCGGYTLLVPLMIVSALSWMVSRPFEPNSIYHKVLIENKLLTHDPDLAMLKRLPVRLNLNDVAPHLPPERTISALAATIAEFAEVEFFPVVDADGKLCGTIRRGEINAALISPDMAQELVVFDLIRKPYGTLSIDDDLALAMSTLEKCGADFLPVVDDDGKFRGLVFKTDIFSQYRRLVRQSDAF